MSGSISELVSGAAVPDPQEPPDYTDRYNTALAPEQEAQYQAWLRATSLVNGRDMSKDNFDYDMRGAFTGGAGQAANGHFPDTYKKPNHPTFSDQSQYNGSDGEIGGRWSQTENGGWAFMPGPTNMRVHGPQGLQEYFRRGDPSARLILPRGEQ